MCVENNFVYIELISLRYTTDCERVMHVINLLRTKCGARLQRDSFQTAWLLRIQTIRKMKLRHRERFNTMECKQAKMTPLPFNYARRKNLSHNVAAYYDKRELPSNLIALNNTVRKIAG